jgi:pimeloyl-ACP methyl ester carboxylesterase
MLSSLTPAFCYIGIVALVLLHGLGTGPEAWRPQVEALGRDRSVLTPRLRLDGGFTIASEAGRLLRELPAEPLDLCGLSLGALIALRMALAEPRRVRRLILCAGFASLPARWRLIQVAVGTIAALVPGSARRELGDLDRSAIRAVFREGRRFDVAAELERLTMPVLVLVGERDRVNAGLSKALAVALPQARLELVTGAGHVANLDAPEAFTSALRLFLDAADPQP